MCNAFRDVELKDQARFFSPTEWKVVKNDTDSQEYRKMATIGTTYITGLSTV